MTRRRDRNWRTPVQVLALLAAIAVPGVPLASGADHARLLIYIESPRVVEAATELVLAGITLEGEGATVTLEPLRHNLSSAELSGHQTLIVNATVPEGAYSTLRVKVSGIRGQVGVAAVAPQPPPDGIAIPVDLVLRKATAEVVYLTWRPVAIDAKTRFHVPDIQSYPVSLPPAGTLALVTSRSSGTVMIVDRLSGKVVGARWMDDDPRGIAYSRFEQLFFVALADRDAIGVLEALSLRVIRTVPLQFGDEPSRLLLSEDGAMLFVLSPGSRTLTAMSSRSLQQQFRIPVGEGPKSLTHDPVTGYIYVACETEGIIQVVDPGLGAIVTAVTLAPAPREIIIDDFTRVLYAGSEAQRRVYHLDLSGTAEGDAGGLNVCGAVLGLAFNPKTLQLYAAIPQCESVAVLRPQSGIEFASIDLPAAPGLMSFDQEYRQLLVVLPDAGAVAICNPNRGLVETVVEVGERPFAVVVP